jgi:hypothetical protein
MALSVFKFLMYALPSVPDPAFYLIADPDPESQTNVDPDPGQTLTSQKVST